MRKKINSYRGITLIESIVTISIITIVMTGMTVLLASTFRSQSYSLQLGQASLIASHAIQYAVKNIRQAQQGDGGVYLLESADDFDIVVYSNIDDDEAIERVHYFLESGDFKEGISEASGTPSVYPSEDQSVKSIATHVVNDENRPVFTYYQSDGNQISSEDPINPGIVRRVRILLYVDINPVMSPNATRVETVTTMRNLIGK